jgi:hypothetical protein
MFVECDASISPFNTMSTCSHKKGYFSIADLFACTLAIFSFRRPSLYARSLPLPFTAPPRLGDAPAFEEVLKITVGSLLRDEVALFDKPAAAAASSSSSSSDPEWASPACRRFRRSGYSAAMFEIPRMEMRYGHGESAPATKGRNSFFCRFWFSCR